MRLIDLSDRPIGPTGVFDRPIGPNEISDRPIGPAGIAAIGAQGPHD